MMQEGTDANARMERIEDTLLHLIEGFARYRSQLMQAYECAQALSSRAALGFTNSEEEALPQEQLDRALQDYFRLRDRIDWWLEQARQIIAGMIEAEERQTPTGAPLPDNGREGAPAHQSEEGPGGQFPVGLFIELEAVF